MSTTTSGGDALVQVEARARRLAREKSYLELVVRLMRRTGEASGVDNVIEALLQSVIDVVGGTNTIVYYFRDDVLWCADLYGEARLQPVVDDPLVARVLETRQPVEREEDFAETYMEAPAFGKAYTWYYPLLAGGTLVGVIVLEHLHFGMRELHQHLPVYFNYAAHVIRNEVDNYSRLREAYDDLNATHVALHEENLARQRTESELLETQAQLEQRVAERTTDLASTNVQLHLELRERLSAEDALRRRNRELAALNRFLAGVAGDVTPRDVLDLAGEALTSILGVPHALAWFVDAAADPLVVPHGAAPLVVEDVPADARATEMAARMPGTSVASLVALPVIVGQQAVAVIALTSPTPRRFDEDALSLATRVGEQAASAIARLRAEADARRLRVAIEQAADSVVITDETGAIQYVNPAFSDTTGYARAEVVGHNPRTFKSGRHDASFYEEMWARLGAGERWHGRLTNRKKSGELFTEDVVIVPVRDARGRVANYIALKRDITRELAREEHLRHAQRMEGIGQLAGGIAHDFNNLLGVMLMQLELIELEHTLPREVSDGLVEVRKAAERAARLTRQLLTFARRQAISMRGHDLNDVVGHQVRMVDRMLPATIALRFEPTVEPLPFQGDASMIEQVIQSLCVNARDAMPEGGQMTVATGASIYVDGAELAHPDARPGRFVWVRVTDTGIGMSADTMDRAFEPFFTTKPLARGAGLGLATSYGIVSQHRGWIDVASELGQGSILTVYLPWFDAEPRPGVQAVAKPATTGQATILLAEDEPGIRQTVKRCLERLGYRVLVAEDGSEALALWARERDHVDLLLSDIVIPHGPSGVELCRQLRQEQPSLRVILMSGYPADLVREGGQVDEGVGFLGKPFSPQQLGHAIELALVSSGDG